MVAAFAFTLEVIYNINYKIRHDLQSETLKNLVVEIKNHDLVS